MTASRAIYVAQAYSPHACLYSVSGHVQVPLKAACLLAERCGAVDFITTRVTATDSLPMSLPPGVCVRLLTHASKPLLESGVRPVRVCRKTLELQRLVRQEAYRSVHFFGGPKTARLAVLTKLASPWCRVLYTPISAPAARGSALGPQLRASLYRRLCCADRAAERDSVVFWRSCTYENGADLVVAAFRALGPRFPNVRFVIAVRLGGEFEAEVHRLASETSNVTAQIHPYANGTEIQDILGCALLAVAPFRRLTINPQISILETLYAGVPVVAANVESCHEAVRDAVNGLLVRPGDSAGFVAAVARLLLDRELLATLRGNARATVEAAFNWGAFEADLERSYAL